MTTLKPRDWTILSHLVMSGQGASGGQTLPELYVKVAPERLQVQGTENAAECNRLRVALSRAVKYLVISKLAAKSTEKRRKLGGQNRPANIFHPTAKAVSLTFPEDVADVWEIGVKQPRRTSVAAFLEESLEDVDIDLSASADEEDADWTLGPEFSEPVDAEEPEVVQTFDMSRAELSLGNIELRAQAALDCLEKQDQTGTQRHLRAILAEARG